MIIIPADVKCVFCTKTFCCKTCREIHEKKVHSEALAELKLNIDMKSLCYICDGQKLPLGNGFTFSSNEILQHVVDFHLPLRCGKCLKTFETVEDLKEANKCCLPATVEPLEEQPPHEEASKTTNQTNESPNVNTQTPIVRSNKIPVINEPENLVIDTKVEKQRQTSTPMANANLCADNSSYSASSIQISSINFTSSTSSDSDAFSPPIAVAGRKDFVSPQRPPRSQPQSRSRNRMPVQATPLRQLMSKSIQRAMQQHGHYRESPFNLQQRKMSFNSTNSSEDHTASLMKFPNESQDALDLRTTPARQRNSEESTRQNTSETDRDLIEFSRIEIKQIDLVIRRSDIKSESSTTASFKSCHSQVERSGSMPELQLTPKIIGNGLLKKTISFDPPSTIEKTPAFLMKSQKINEEDDDDDVFFTPRATPLRAPFKRALDIPSPIEEGPSDCIVSIDESGTVEKENEGSKSGSNLWNFVSSVMKIASRKSDDSGGSVSSNSEKTWSFGFKKPGFVQKAEKFFTKRSEDSDDQSFKRRRTSSTSETFSETVKSPAQKRQKIQARKPIGRMRNLS